MRAIAAFVLLAGWLPPLPCSRVQDCSTRCQDRQTDCVLRCDGDLECAAACRREAERCVEVCRKPPEL